MLQSNRSSTEVNAQLSIFVDSIRFEKLRSMIAGTKMRLEVNFGKIKEKVSVEVKGNSQILAIQKVVKFEYKFEDQLTVSLVKKSPVMSFSTVVGVTNRALI